ncbi:hypothetical protein [Beijerinckia indica]|uniref:Major tropism determinant N-terminal domain-containing protein n=1 Tax=Beijerinckia indica subsp. indica (strain ATCC 9039 / DSM 1715 / NCIMB 8712) TaxID=395963 RepID=B2IJI2_BEII9|nr:hypothetical protein [Beijerinckia indica]ACB96295.1 hypothetical protein Bind_2723 [Beijerinckia indica subsp. indica ATCC 9039]
MAVQVQLRRGSETDIASFKGAQGEIVMDTTNNRLILCDGTTQGGVPLAKLSEVGQEPLAATQIIAQSPHGAAMTFEVMEEMIALSGNSNQSTIAIPARAIVFAVSVLVVTGITGATHFNVDATLSPNGAAGGTGGQFGADLSIAAGSNNSGIIGPTAWYNSSTITLTAQGGSFTAGAVRLAIHCMLCGVPAS